MEENKKKRLSIVAILGIVILIFRKSLGLTVARKEKKA